MKDCTHWQTAVVCDRVKSWVKHFIPSRTNPSRTGSYRMSEGKVISFISLSFHFPHRRMWYPVTTWDHLGLLKSALIFSIPYLFPSESTPQPNRGKLRPESVYVWYLLVFLVLTCYWVLYLGVVSILWEVSTLAIACRSDVTGVLAQLLWRWQGRNPAKK